MYATSPLLSSSVRPTEDVDIVVELLTYADHTRIEERLRDLGFTNDSDSGVICRYVVQGIIVDIMPTNSTILGFSNKWYTDGLRNAVNCKLDEETEVLIFSLPYFLASKWEAYKSRGGNDLRTSKDFEDMVYIFEHIDDFPTHLIYGPDVVRKYLAQEIGEILLTPEFEEGLYCRQDQPHMELILPTVSRN
ncbi:nucleotidyl transferase AbiEii/AbiGii toxin family protein [Chitinophaga sp. Hz27]|uniref:nucleotidyl transferase AbiEii/AbiGii toxin family protein n=1 Tax=Chitinophaga sp. Hz27 TaxID=3347169 RepID=UPI0035D7E0CE